MPNQANIKCGIELQDEDLKKASGGTAGDEISFGNFKVKENGVYTDGSKYVFVVSKKPNFPADIIDALYRKVIGDKFINAAFTCIESINHINNSYQFVCITTKQKFKDAKTPSDL